MSTTPEQASKVMQYARCLHDEQQVIQAIDTMAGQINSQLSGKNPVAITVLNGGVILAGYLLPRLDFPLQMDYMHASRYRGKLSGGQLNWMAKPGTDLDGRVVLIIDDILDEGLTLDAIVQYCRDAGAAEVYTCVLVDKNHDRKQGYLNADFTGLDVEDSYVFGFGMDYKGYLRNAPGIYAVVEE